MPPSKPLSLYHAQLDALRKQRVELDIDFAQVIAEALKDGYAIVDIMYPPKPASPKPDIFFGGIEL